MVKVTTDKCFASDSSTIEAELMAKLGDDESVIRIYEWLEPAISVGRNQSSKLITEGIPIEQRLTGGGALYLGDGELCYTVVSKKDIAPKVLLERIHSSIAEELLTLGIVCSGAHTDTTDEYKSVECFNSIGRNELLVEGKKLVGSAVTRVRGVYLHHGVMYMTDSYKKLREYTKEDSEYYGERIVSLAELGVKADLKEMQDIIVKIITQVLMEE